MLNICICQFQKCSADPESERLLSDNASGAAVSENGSVSTATSTNGFDYRKAIDVNVCLQGDVSSDYSPNKLPNPLAKSVSPPMAHRSVVLQRQQSATSKLAKYHVPRCPEEVVLRQQGGSNKPILQRSSMSYTEPTTDEKKKDNNLTGNR